MVEGALCVVAGVGLRLVAPLPAWPLWSSAVWLLVEELRSVLPWGGFPWGRLAFAAIGDTSEAVRFGWRSIQAVKVSKAKYALSRLSELAAEEPAVAAGEGDRRRAQPRGDRYGRPAGHHLRGLLADPDDDPGRRRAQRAEVVRVVRTRDNVLPHQRVATRTVVFGGQPEGGGVGSGRPPPAATGCFPSRPRRPTSNPTRS